MNKAQWNEDEGRLHTPSRRWLAGSPYRGRPYDAAHDPLVELAWARVAGIGYRSSRYARWRQIAMSVPMGRLPGGAK